RGTSRTRISTPSLHDALPIYAERLTARTFELSQFLVKVLGRTRFTGAGRPRSTALLPPYHVAVFDRETLVESLEQPGVFFEAWQDRKSTRLNSSHQIISYAVF